MKPRAPKPSALRRPTADLRLPERTEAVDAALKNHFADQLASKRKWAPRPAPARGGKGK
jgi:hypothetical protein